VSWSIRALGLLTFGLVTNLLSDVFPRPALIALILVGAVVAGMVHLPEDAPVRKVLPGALLYLAVAAVALAVVTPPSWTGPLTVVSVLLLLIGCTGLTMRRRADALVGLAGLTVFTLGVLSVVAGTHQTHTSAKFVCFVLGVFVSLFGLMLIADRHELAGAGGFSMAVLRDMRLTWSRAGVIGLLAVVRSVQVAREGDLPIAALLAVAGVAWLAATMAFVFANSADTFTGTMLTLCGVATTGLGLAAFGSQMFLLGVLALPAGATMAAGGLTLLESRGVLTRFRSLFRSPRDRPRLEAHTILEDRRSGQPKPSDQPPGP
jgi:hypothetical protein